MMRGAGTSAAIEGIAAIANSKTYTTNAVFVFSDLKTWAWIDRRGTRRSEGNLNATDATSGIPRLEVDVNSKGMAGWIGFAAILMLIVGGIDFFQGLIGLFRDDYYVVTASGYLAVNLTTWSWVLMIWGVLLFLAGLGLIAGQGWARWFTIVLVSLNIFAQLGFLGNSNYPLWALTALTLNIVVLYALTARWSESQDQVAAY